MGVPPARPVSGLLWALPRPRKDVSGYMLQPPALQLCVQALVATASCSKSHGARAVLLACLKGLIRPFKGPHKALKGPYKALRAL